MITVGYSTRTPNPEFTEYLKKSSGFKKINVIPDGKNHGLIFILDWSGSMQTVLKDTCKQLYNLIWFCKKVSIPFEVYAFTNEWKKDLNPHYERKEGLICVSEEFCLLNIFTS